MKKFIASKKLRIAIYIFGSLFILLFTFQAGMFVGVKKASFYNRIGEKYFREVNGNTENLMSGTRRDDFGNNYGAIGKVIQVNLPQIIVEDQGGIDKTITVSTSTSIRSGKKSLSPADVKVDNYVVIFGPNTDDSIINARLVRILPHTNMIRSSTTKIMMKK